MTDPNIVISAVESALIASAWPHLEPHFVRGCNRILTHWTPEKVRSEAEAGDLTLWAIQDTRKPLPFLGGLATGFQTICGEKVVLFCVLGGRDLHRWLEMLTTKIETLAKSQGATRALIEGRLGWQPRTRALGYAPISVTLQKVL